MSEYSVVEIRLDVLLPHLTIELYQVKFLILMAQNLVPYIRVILADIVSIT